MLDLLFPLVVGGLIFLIMIINWIKGDDPLGPDNDDEPPPPWWAF